MTTKERLMQARPGTFIHVAFKSEKKPATKHKGHQLVKHIVGTFRVGINYSNLSTVRQAVEAGERSEAQSLPWGSWKQYPYIIEHKGKEYMRLYPAANPKQVHIRYFVDGAEVSQEVFNQYLPPSEAKSSGFIPTCITVAVENLIEE